MTISELSLKRPVLALVMNIIIILFGVIGFRFLGVRDYPAIDPPVINVRTLYPGANADVMESQITEPLEKAINGIAGVKNISSGSSQGTSNITVEFELGSNLEEAANDVRDKVSQSVRSLPSDLDAPPVVTKADASSDPILSMTVQSDRMNALQLTEYANNNLLERIQTIPGVSNVIIWGEKKYAMRIWLQPEKLLAYGLTLQDIQQALENENIELPGGKIAGNTTELTVRTFGRLQTEDDFNNLVVQTTAGRNILLRDVGTAVLGPENEETILKESGVPMIALALVPQPGSNYIAIADEFYKRYDQIQKELPTGMQLNIALDQTQFVRKSINEVKETLILAFALVVLIIFLFFRDWIIAIRPLIDIPVSLIGAFSSCILRVSPSTSSPYWPLFWQQGLWLMTGLWSRKIFSKKWNGGLTNTKRPVKEVRKFTLLSSPHRLRLRWCSYPSFFCKVLPVGCFVNLELLLPVLY